MAIINTDYPGTLGELTRRLILIVGAVYVQVHMFDHVREVRLYVTVGLLDISVWYILKQWIEFFARSDWLLNQ